MSNPEQPHTEQNEDAWKLAGEKFKKFGDLGMTQEDHEALGSTPSKELILNPGKTLGEIWDNEKIEYFLTELKTFINSKAEGGLIKYQEIQKENYQATLRYLKEINRLPVSFQNELA